MRIKLSDLKLLMQYLDKEAPEFVEVSLGSLDIGITFSFKDLEDRDCEIKLFMADSKTTPDLTKKMKLYSRLVKPIAKPSEEE